MVPPQAKSPDNTKCLSPLKYAKTTDEVMERLLISSCQTHADETVQLGMRPSLDDHNSADHK